MTAEIRDGWLFGELEDDTGRAWPIERFPQPSARGPLAAGTPELILHTTETWPNYVGWLGYPSQWQCGEGMIGQHIKLGLSGDSVNEWDRYAQQIEMVADSKLFLWLPAESTLGPTIAITAWLHRTFRIRTGLSRPNGQDWPLVLDRGPQASEPYYRRHAGLWPGIAGVYGHVDIPANKHWDPGSFNYPVFFRRVAAAIAVQEGEDMTDKEKAQLAEALLKSRALENAIEDIIEGTTPPAAASRTRKRAYRALKEAGERPLPAPAGPHDHDDLYPPKDHPHSGSVSVR
jgi:hypothetical protein